jgi:hypothetical protein
MLDGCKRLLTMYAPTVASKEPLMPGCIPADLVWNAQLVADNSFSDNALNGVRSIFPKHRNFWVSANHSS